MVTQASVTPVESAVTPCSNLSPDDHRHLGRLETSLQVIRDRVAGVVQGHLSGFYLYGRGGIGKSYTVIEELRRQHADYRVVNGRLTARALFECLKADSECVHLLEDVESVIADRNAVSILRAALWANQTGRDGRPEARVIWSISGKREEFIFRGGLILTGNRPMSQLPEIQALGTRIVVQELVVNDQQIAAQMRSVASRGYRRGDHELGREACLEVAEFVIAEYQRRGQELNMRALVRGFEDRLQVEDDQAGCGWQDLVASSIAGHASVVGPITPVGVRERTRLRDLELVRALAGLPRDQRLSAWRTATGKSERSMYRRIEQLGLADSDNLEACPVSALPNVTK